MSKELSEAAQEIIAQGQVWNEVDRILDEYLSEIGDYVLNAENGSEEQEMLEERQSIVSDVLQAYRHEFPVVD